MKERENEITEDVEHTLNLIDYVFAFDDSDSNSITYNCYYVRVLDERKVPKDHLGKYFYEYADAKKYYDELLDEFMSDSFNYNGYEVSLNKKVITIKNEEEDSETIFDEDEEDSQIVYDDEEYIDVDDDI